MVSSMPQLALIADSLAQVSRSPCPTAEQAVSLSLSSARSLAAHIAHTSRAVAGLKREDAVVLGKDGCEELTLSSKTR